MKGLRHSWAAAILLCAAAASAQTARPARQYTIEQFLTTTSISGASFSPDESAHPVLVEQDRHLERLHDPGRRRRVDASHEVDDRLDLRGVVLSERRSHPLHARSGRQRAESSLRAHARRPGARPHARGEAEGAVRRLDAGWRGFYVSTNERDARFFDIYRYDAKTYERTLFYKNEHGYFPDARVRRRQVGGADEAEHDERQRHLPVERGDEGAQASQRTQGRRAVRARRRSIRRRNISTTSPTRAAEFARLRRYALAAGTGTKTSTEGRLGRHVRRLLARRPLSRHRRQP